MSFPILILSVKIDLANVAFFNVTIIETGAGRLFEALLMSVEVEAILALLAVDMSDKGADVSESRMRLSALGAKFLADKYFLRRNCTS